MGAPTSSLPAPDTLPGLLLTLTALAGEFPTSLVHRLPGSDSYKEAAVKRLKREKLLRTYYHDGLRGLRLNIIIIIINSAIATIFISLIISFV